MRLAEGGYCSSLETEFGIIGLAAQEESSCAQQAEPDRPDGAAADQDVVAGLQAPALQESIDVQDAVGHPDMRRPAARGDEEFLGRDVEVPHQGVGNSAGLRA